MKSPNYVQSITSNLRCWLEQNSAMYFPPADTNPIAPRYFSACPLCLSYLACILPSACCQRVRLAQSFDGSPRQSVNSSVNLPRRIETWYLFRNAKRGVVLPLLAHGRARRMLTHLFSVVRALGWAIARWSPIMALKARLRQVHARMPSTSNATRAKLGSCDDYLGRGPLYDNRAAQQRLARRCGSRRDASHSPKGLRIKISLSLLACQYSLFVLLADLGWRAQILAGAKDEVGLILFGTQETKNDLAADGYSHVVVLRDLVTPDVDLLREVEKIRPGDCDGDCMRNCCRWCSGPDTPPLFPCAVVDALVVAMDLLVKKVGDRNYQKRVFLITDAGSDVNEDDLHTILDKFNEINAVLNVIGVDFAEDRNLGEDRSHISEIKEHNEKLIQKICEHVKGRVIPIRNALDLLSFTSSKSILQRSSFRGWFELSRHVRIPVWSFPKTKEDTFPRMAKISRLSQESANPDTLAVKSERTYHPLDDPDKEVEFANLSKGYRYGKTLVPFDRIDQQNLKFTSTPCLQLLGFCAKDSVPRQHFMGSVDAIVPLPADDTASQAISALAQAMESAGSVAIVRFVKRANSAPQLGVLSPHQNDRKGYACLYFNKLPLHEDIRNYTFASLGAAAPKKSFVPSQPQLDAMEDLVNSMDLTASGEGEPEEALKPKRTYNPALQHFFACVQSKALHPERPLPPLDPIVDQYVNPDKNIMERAARALDNVKGSFHLVRTELKEKQSRRRFWSDAFAEAAAGIQLDSYVNDDAKRQKLHDGLPEGGPRLSIQSLITEVTDVGSATPVEDFNAMISRRDVDLVDKAIEQMQRQIVKIVNESVRDMHYPKALECLKALRQGCIEQAEVEAFNRFLADVKKNYRGSKRAEFWQLICQEGVSLITAEESSDSDFTDVDAHLFLTTDGIPGYLESEVEGEAEALPPRPPRLEPEAEDLFDEIE